MTGSPAAMRSVLRKDDVFTKAENGLIGREFRAEVVIFRRVRKHFDDDLRIEYEFLSLQVFGLHFAANHRYVRVAMSEPSAAGSTKTLRTASLRAFHPTGESDCVRCVRG